MGGLSKWQFMICLHEALATAVYDGFLSFNELVLKFLKKPVVA